MTNKREPLKEAMCDKNIPSLGKRSHFLTAFLGIGTWPRVLTKADSATTPYDASFVPHSTPATSSASFDTIRASGSLSAEFVLYRLPPKHI